jgi:hypothetical protein
VGRQRKHKNEVQFLQGLLKSIKIGQDLDSRPSLIDRLEERIVTLQTGLSPDSTTVVSSEVDEGRNYSPGTDIQAESDLMLPAIEEADSSRSIVTIEDVAWGRRSKTLHAENKSDISLPPLSSILHLTPTISKDLPSEEIARVLIKYHLDHLCWFHNALHAPSFLRQCESYWTTGRCEDPLWLALYFSVLSVSQDIDHMGAVLME